MGSINSTNVSSETPSTRSNDGERSYHSKTPEPSQHDLHANNGVIVDRLDARCTLLKDGSPDCVRKHPISIGFIDSAMFVSPQPFINELTSPSIQAQNESFDASKAGSVPPSNAFAQNIMASSLDYDWQCNDMNVKNISPVCKTLPCCRQPKPLRLKSAPPDPNPCVSSLSLGPQEAQLACVGHGHPIQFALGPSHAVSASAPHHYATFPPSLGIQAAPLTLAPLKHPVLLKPSQLNSPIATPRHYHGLSFSSSIGAQLVQHTTDAPIAMTPQCITDTDLVTPNLNSLASLEQLLTELNKQLNNVDVALKFLKNKEISKCSKTKLGKQITMLAVNAQNVFSTWDMMKLTNIKASAVNATVNMKHKLSVTSCEAVLEKDKIQNDVLPTNYQLKKVDDEDTLRSCFEKNNWPIVQETSEAEGIIFHCMICKTKMHGLGNVTSHVLGKTHGKELKKCMPLLDTFFLVGSNLHCKLCRTEVPSQLKNLFQHVNGRSHEKNMKINSTPLKPDSEKDEVTHFSTQKLQTASFINYPSDHPKIKNISSNIDHALVNNAAGIYPETLARSDQLLIQHTTAAPSVFNSQNLSSTIQRDVFNPCMENSNLTDTDSVGRNIITSVSIQQLRIELKKMLDDVDVALKLLITSEVARKLEMNLAKLADIIQKFLSTWGSIKLTNNKAVAVNATVNVKHELSNTSCEIVPEEEKIQNDVLSKKIHLAIVDEEKTIMKSYLGEHNWQIFKETSEKGEIRFYCKICKIRIYGFGNVVGHVIGEKHGKKFKKCMPSFDNFFLVGGYLHCKLCRTQVPPQLNNMFEHVNGARHGKKMAQNSTDMKPSSMNDEAHISTQKLQITSFVNNLDCLNSQKRPDNIVDTVLNNATVLCPETLVTHNQLLDQIKSSPSLLVTSNIVGYYCEPCNVYGYDTCTFGKHSKTSVHLATQNSKTNRIFFCETCKIVLWGNVSLLEQHKKSDKHIEINKYN